MLDARVDGGGWSPRFLVGSVDLAEDGSCLAVEASDDEAGLALATVLRLHPSGVLEAGHTLRNLGDAPYWCRSWRSACPCRPGRSSCST